MAEIRISDTRALDAKELTPRQVAALGELRAILIRMSADGAKITPKPKTPWAVADLRESRAILLSGRRGSGKTTLMLTLLQVDPPACVRFLPFLDLDPIPRGLPMIGWLLQALDPMPLA